MAPRGQRHRGAGGPPGAEVLGAALSEFLRAMDPEVRAAATAEGALRIATYNYLVHREHGKFRRQFARSFPSLLDAVANAAPGSLGAELRPLVDLGVPLVKGLAARWGVCPGVVRQLIGRPGDLVGAQWATRCQPAPWC